MCEFLIDPSDFEEDLLDRLHLFGIGHGHMRSFVAMMRVFPLAVLVLVSRIRVFAMMTSSLQGVSFIGVNALLLVMEGANLNTQGTLEQSHGFAPRGFEALAVMSVSMVRNLGNQFGQSLQCIGSLVIKRRRGVLHFEDTLVQTCEIELIGNTHGSGNTRDLFQVAAQFQRVLADVERKDDIIGNS